jgi:micrococcal nuclease
MSRLPCCPILMVLSLLPMMAGAAPPATDHQMLAGTVTRVIDGDTIEVQLGKRRIPVHLRGIDAPEPGQPWCKEATAALAQMVLNQDVDLEPFGLDDLNRRTTIVFVGEEEVGAAMVRDGNAWADRRHLSASDTELCELEADARERKVGLWALAARDRIAPWEYRRRFLHRHFRDYGEETVAQCMAAAEKAR